MPKPLSAARRKCCAIWAATHTASPSPTTATACLPSTESESATNGMTTPMAEQQKVMTLAATEFPATILSACPAEGLCPHPSLRLSYESLPHPVAGAVPATAGRFTTSAHGRSRTGCHLALSSLPSTRYSTTVIHYSGASAAVSCPRFVVTPQNIYDSAVCSPHAYALVCLRLGLSGLICISSAPVEPLQRPKSVVSSSAFSLSTKTQSAFERAIRVLSP
jgi:hypothetical protein